MYLVFKHEDKNVLRSMITELTIHQLSVIHLLKKVSQNYFFPSVIIVV